MAPMNNTTRATIKNVLTAIATLLEARPNRFGKLEFYSEESMAARELIRQWALEFKCLPSGTVLEQAGKVARAVLKAQK